MTDRVNAIYVVLEQDMRIDDARPIMDAIIQIRGVLSVQANVTDYNSVIAETRAKHELREKLFQLLMPDNGQIT